MLITDAQISFELGLGWFGNYDSYDLAALNLLSHGPPVRRVDRRVAHGSCI